MPPRQASDILARLVAKDELSADSYRVLYESERFPPVAFGCAYNLSTDMREAITTAMLELDWTGTKLADEDGCWRDEEVLTDFVQGRLGQHPSCGSGSQQHQ